MTTSLIFKRLLRDDRGATAIEYGLIVSLIVMVMIGAFQGIADKSTGMWGVISNKFAAASRS
jgi:pilus assembly protein Flp/PilA